MIIYNATNKTENPKEILIFFEENTVQILETEFLSRNMSSITYNCRKVIVIFLHWMEYLCFISQICEDL